MGQWSGLWTENAKGNWVWEGQFQTLICSKMSRSYLTSFKLRRYSGVMKPQPVGYNRERGLYTRSVRALGSIREGR
jgi:hypothetical protein